MKTRLFVFALVLVLCCSSAFAFVPLKGFSKPLEEPVQDTPAEESKKTSKSSTETMPDSQNSLTESEVKAMTLEELQDFVKGKMWLTQKDKDEIIKANEQVGKDIEELKQALNKEKNGNKFMADVGMLFNFSEGARFGALANVGCRLGSGLLLKVGAETMVGGVNTDGFYMEMPSIRDVNLTCSIGWEW